MKKTKRVCPVCQKEFATYSNKYCSMECFMSVVKPKDEFERTYRRNMYNLKHAGISAKKWMELNSLGGSK